MARCDRQRSSNDPRRVLYAAIALIGIGLSLAVGPGVAAATPSDPSDSSQSAETSGTAGRDDTSDTADTGSPRASDEGTESEPEPSAEPEPTDEADETASIEEADADADVRTSTDGAPTNAGDESTRDSRQNREPETEPAQAVDEPAADDSDSAASQSRSVVADPDVMPAAAAPATATTELAVPAAPDAATLRSLVSVRPVTVNSIVTDVLTWVGLGPLAKDLPVPATPVSALMQSLWLAVRQTQYILNNQRPTAEVTISGPGPDGVVTGSLNAVDYDDIALTYTVTAAPERGSVVIDAFGHFTYTPVAGTSLRGDQFTITIDDSVGNPFHIHGLLGLLGITGPTEVTIVVAAPPSARQDHPATIDLTDLLSRGGVDVTADSKGAVRVIDGTFTDSLVTTAADAAAVMNAVAPALGAAAGFADPSAITIAHAGAGDSREHFYQLTETVSGITVVGSEVLLVTDANGTVTSLFNNYHGLAEGFGVTPHASVDEPSEVRLIAATTHLGNDDLDALESFLAQAAFNKQLVIYRRDEAEPSLAWRVVVTLPDTGDMSQSGATYLIRADGVNAGDIIVTIANAQDYTATAVARDWLGDQRTITVDTTRVFFFTSHKMVDSTRNIVTYRTSYSLFGFGSPVLPGTVVKRGWLFGWDKGAVSAHANTAVAYDYFVDVLGRTSFDGAGALIKVSIRYNPRTTGAGFANAFWDPTRQLFGYGDSGYLQAALDVVGHEYTHAVVSYVVGDGGSVLDYGESGALNEAYADVFGMLIEDKSGAGRWLIGEDSDYGIVRNLADPTSVVTVLGPYRDHYSTRYTGSGDDGGEHINSTIFSHAAYRMMTDPATSGVSDETWARVFYHSLYRLSPGAVFADGRAAVLSAATALGLTAPQLAAIADAFYSVGIGSAAASYSIAA